MIRRRMRRRGGFTLLELMAVVIIIAILAGIALPNFLGAVERSRKRAAKSQVTMFAQALSTYKLELGTLPPDDQGLNALIEDPGIDGWDGPYLEVKEIPKDPWQSEYVYHREPNRGVNFDIFSPGEDQRPDTEDDIGNW